VENIPLQAERHSGKPQKPFAFPPESVFTFRPECCSESQRNGVQPSDRNRAHLRPDSPVRNLRVIANILQMAVLIGIAASVWGQSISQPDVPITIRVPADQEAVMTHVNMLQLMKSGINRSFRCGSRMNSSRLEELR
jgi:hypothetical protein